MNVYRHRLESSVKPLKERLELVTLTSLAKEMGVSKQRVQQIAKKSNFDYKLYFKEVNDEIKKIQYDNLPIDMKVIIGNELSMLENRKARREEINKLKNSIRKRVSKIPVAILKTLTHRQILQTIRIDCSPLAIHLLYRLDVPYLKRAKRKNVETIKILNLLSQLDTSKMYAKQLAQEAEVDIKTMRSIIYNYKIPFRRRYEKTTER